jgi:hypothetical protein
MAIRFKNGGALRIIVNGKHYFPLKGQMSYDDLCIISGITHATITWRYTGASGVVAGSLKPREKLNLVNGMIFNVTRTGEA